jgi:hypothetical protein
MITVEPIPVDSASLRLALAGLVRQLGLTESALSMTGEFPSIAALHVDLTGARFHRELKMAPAAQAAQPAEPAFFVRDLQVMASPAYLESLPFTLSAQAGDAVFALAGSTLSFSRCGNGRLEISVTRADLEAALTTVASEAAAKKGGELKSVKVDLQSEGPRVLKLHAVAVAKALFFTATLTITGRVEISDNLEVRLADLTCTGDGMIANMAAGAIRPRLAALGGRAFSLRDFVPSLHTVTLDAADGLRVRAEFGG